MKKQLLETKKTLLAKVAQIDSQINLLEVKRMQQLAESITYTNLPIEGDLIGNEFHVDFDDIGNIWAEKFEEKYGHEYDDLNDEDNDNFGIIQDEVVNDFEAKLSKAYKKPITLKFIY